MNTFTLAWASIRERSTQSALCTLSVAAGIALLCAVYLFSNSIATGFSRNAEGVDIVVGAKGSPLQLVLSSVYHVDIPAGNIDIAAYEHFRHNPNISKAIPLAFGDNYNGFRMVGTTPEYINLYNGELAEGKVYKADFETVAGSRTGLKLGKQISVTHGFSTDSGHIHDDHVYTVTGVLKPTGTVIDKLLITDIESVQRLHSNHGHHDEADGEGHFHKAEAHEQGHDHKDVHHHEGNTNFARQITSIILKVRSPIDRMNMPRRINETSDLMAAVPSYEMARFTQSLGIGRQLVLILGAGFVVLSMLMLWATLSSGLALRRYDLAVMRVLGATQQRLAATVMFEAFIITGLGSVLGIILGHLIAFGIFKSFENLQGLVLPLSVLKPHRIDINFIMIGLFAGQLAAILPCLNAARTNITKLLAKGRG